MVLTGACGCSSVTTFWSAHHHAGGALVCSPCLLLSSARRGHAGRAAFHPVGCGKQVFYEFYVFRFQNKDITHAAATAIHFLADAVCCFVTCIFITEVTKLAAGRLRPDFLQVSALTPSY